MTRLLAVALAFVAWPALAQDEPIVRLDNPASVALALREEGFRAKLTQDSKDRPMIDTGIGGTYFSIKFFGCKEGIDCVSLLFTAAFDLDQGIELDRVNEWNGDVLMGRAYLDSECDPVIDHFVYVGRDRQISHFTRELEYWGDVLEDFRDHIGFDEDEADTVISCGGNSVL